VIGRSASNGNDGFLRVDQVHKWFGDLHVLRGVTVTVEHGEVIVLIGPSGSGKSTLLRTMNMLEEPTMGKVWFEGEDLTDVRVDLNQVRTRMGMVFQHFNLFPHKTALANITLALQTVLGLGEEPARERALDQLGEVGLRDKAGSYPSQLSGGQQQRVAIARALAMQPKLMLFDEVTSALDPELIKGVLEVMARLASEGMTMVVVTHEMGFAREVGSRMLFLDRGVVLEEGDPREMFADPQHARTREFFSQIL
jgi:ABC-type polar amino acid transport system ATPase subunit